MEVEFIIERIEDVFVLHVDGLFPIEDVSFVDEAVELSALTIFCGEVLFKVILLKDIPEEAVFHVIHKLTVLVV